jgi:hypothetical protein
MHDDWSATEDAERREDALAAEIARAAEELINDDE